MIVVSNTTPLIGLASIERFDLLKSLFSEIHIAQAVYQEAVVAGHEEGGAKREISGASWIKTIAVKDRLAVEVLLDELDLGESETIVLARELGGKALALANLWLTLFWSKLARDNVVGSSVGLMKPCL